jgi:hypothetical protein
MTVADEHLTTLIFDLDRWDREDAERGLGPDPNQPTCVRDALAVFESLQPIIGIVIKLGGDQRLVKVRREMLNGRQWSLWRAATCSSVRPAQLTVG